MKRCTWLTALALGLGMWLVTISATHSAAADGDLKSAIDKLADGKGSAADIAKKNELGEVMHLFKLRTKKGWGVGGKAGAITPDGIEAKLMGLGKNANAADVKKNADAYEQMAKRTAAIAKVTDAHAPKEKKAGKDPKDWKKFADEMKEQSDELAKAAKAGDAAKVKAAANKVVGACNECHTIFRD